LISTIKFKNIKSRSEDEVRNFIDAIHSVTRIGVWVYRRSNKHILLGTRYAFKSNAPTTRGASCHQVFRDEDGIWVLKNTAGLDFDYHYVLFFWNYKPAWDTIKFKWRVAVAGGAKVRLYYWDGNSWEYITENAGGTSPASLTTGVKNYYNGDNLILLAVGGTKPGDRHTKCDIGKLIQ
jgi:hypothetical protein